jgi:S-DNA-T family DNA segregation ATPase FtsK/SpoIIIE
MILMIIQNRIGAVLPAGAAEFFKQRATEAAGLGLLAGAALLLAALATFNPADPSLNHATDSIASNVLGERGSYLADVLLHSWGWAAVAPAVVFAVWGLKMIRKQRPEQLGLRLVTLFPAILLLSTGLAAVPTPDIWPLATSLGGSVGNVLLRSAVSFASNLRPELATTVVALSCLLLGFTAWMFSLGLSWSEWRTIGQTTIRSSITVVHAIHGLSRGLWRQGQSRVRSEPSFSAHATLSGHALTDDAGTDGDVGVSDEVVVPKAAKIKVSRKAKGESQGKLEFEDHDNYRFPPLDLLHPPAPAIGNDSVNRSALQENAKLLATVLDDFGVRGEIVKVRPGPVVTLYELEPAPGTKSSRVIGLSDDIARSMSAVSARIAVIPGRNVIGIELPNVRRETVGLRELLASDTLERNCGKLTLALGKDIGGAPVLVDLARMPHLLIAGTTGSGKSVAVNAMILSLLYQLAPSNCKFILIDPKMLELSVYDDIPHLLCPVVTDPTKAVVALKWTVREMETRYRAMSQLGVRNITGYNARVAEAKRKGESLVRRVQTGFGEDGRPVVEEQELELEPLPLIVVVVDEMADLMLVAGKDIEAAVQRLAQMARAAGIHLIMATQRPSVDVITGTIKANFPTRISFHVTSKIDSRTILGEQGAEQLLGQGDMLYMATGGRVTRVHGPFVSDEEVEAVVKFLKSQCEPNYIPEVTEGDDEIGGTEFGLDEEQSGDELYDEAVSIVAREGKASTSFVQRRLQIGYNRAARIMEMMEAEGVVSKADRVGRREVLVGDRSA